MPRLVFYQCECTSVRQIQQPRGASAPTHINALGRQRAHERGEPSRAARLAIHAPGLSGSSVSSALSTAMSLATTSMQALRGLFAVAMLLGGMCVVYTTAPEERLLVG